MDLDEALEIEDALGLGRSRGGPGQEGQDHDGREGQEQGAALHMVYSVHLCNGSVQRNYHLYSLSQSQSGRERLG